MKWYFLLLLAAIDELETEEVDEHGDNVRDKVIMWNIYSFHFQK